MIINHNIAALNTYRQMSAASSLSQKNMSRLSSGLRINSASDDAAGLSISEKMRAQIRGLDQASKNAQDGISLLQTAEGGLTEVHSILDRMKELATQSANDTNTDKDRVALQNEMNQLTSEINRIGNTTEFNDTKVLNGGGTDPTAAVKVSGNGLTVPGMSGGEGAAEQLASADITFVTPTTAGDYKDKSFTITIGTRTLTVNTTAKNTGAVGVTASSSGDTITLATSNDGTNYTTGKDVAAALKDEISRIISADSNLKGNYTAAADVTGKLTISTTALTMDENGKLQGIGTSGKVSLDKGTLVVTEFSAISNTGAIGKNATSVIDFSNATTKDLVGSGIVINGKKVDFYDSADGKYTGSADFAIDLNVARNPEQIVDRIVDALSGKSATPVKAATGTLNYNVDNSAIDNVFITKSGTDKLLITAKTAGVSGNDYQIGNNAAVTVTNTYQNDKVSDEGVVSARGLADGEHKIVIENKGKTATVSKTDGGIDDNDSLTIDGDAALENGKYRLISTGTVNTPALEKLNADGSWTTLDDAANAAVVVNGGATFTVNGADVTIHLADYALTDFNTTAGADYVEFSVSTKYEAKLYEAGSVDKNGNPVAGLEVNVANGQSSVKLNAHDGVGEVVVNIGTFDPSKFDTLNDTITWSFETKSQTETSSEVVGGTFTTKLQIGASTGQGFQIDITDMRARALGVSGSTAGGNAADVKGAKYRSMQEVTNGTDNTGIEYALDISTHDTATAALTVIDNAIAAVSKQRSQIGAYQNRLDHTINNLNASSQNLTTAESNIRDVNMAKEMMEFTKNNILSQAGQAMLAQANQQPQQVLQLLR
ncbi:flagellin domain protein [Desulfofarcimen acetoxidans DSM 771]|uniref:Flagellin n=1 Tax=Desulfofarcimen acetoxidans (strain ATCC 49208 / DSM 771 / KCTC 5769 / VKM B-1644 / 5575) TaxID=485916 RepID=C8W1D2_DESAS|nr:flagellin domain protein [Desulfofarcimen acetoxidans DSM 771]